MKKLTLFVLCALTVGALMLSGCGKKCDNTVAKRITKTDARMLLHDK